jgi:hypothetical protein
LKQLVFTNNIGDPSMLQEKLAYDMMRFAGIPASHVCYVELWIDFVDDDLNPIYWGVYSMIERIDKKFLSNRFGRDSTGGNLYKASYAQRGPMDLIYYGESIDDYPTVNGNHAYGNATNTEIEDYSDVINLMYVIDGVDYESPEAFAQAVEKVLNVDDFLRYMAVVNTLGNWDSYPYTSNNFYLFNNSVSGVFEWIPWDLTWGGNPRHPLHELGGPGLVERAPHYDNVFEDAAYRHTYTAYLDLLARHWFNEENISKLVDKYHRLISPYVSQSTGDKDFFGDQALFPVDAFNDSWRGLVDFARQRHLFILDALQP